MRALRSRDCTIIIACSRRLLCACAPRPRSTRRGWTSTTTPLYRTSRPCSSSPASTAARSRCRCRAPSSSCTASAPPRSRRSCTAPQALEAPACKAPLLPPPPCRTCSKRASSSLALFTAKSTSRSASTRTRSPQSSATACSSSLGRARRPSPPAARTPVPRSSLSTHTHTRLDRSTYHYCVYSVIMFVAVLDISPSIRISSLSSPLRFCFFSMLYQHHYSVSVPYHFQLSWRLLLLMIMATILSLDEQ